MPDTTVNAAPDLKAWVHFVLRVQTADSKQSSHAKPLGPSPRGLPRQSLAPPGSTHPEGLDCGERVLEVVGRLPQHVRLPAALHNVPVRLITKATTSLRTCHGIGSTAPRRQEAELHMSAETDDAKPPSRMTNDAKLPSRMPLELAGVPPPPLEECKKWLDACAKC
jgi:hypothetical protein